MKQSHFFAHLARMKLIQRWPLMRSVSSENISEHSLQVAFVAHALALIKTRSLMANSTQNTLPYLACTMTPVRCLLEIYQRRLNTTTQTLPKNIKDRSRSRAKTAFDAARRVSRRLRPFLISGTASKEEQSIVKQADTICAYLKCLEELSAGNHEYEQAKRRLEETLEQRKSPEMDYFLTTFAPSFELSLDEIS